MLALLLSARPDLTGEVRANRFVLRNDRGDDVGGLGFDGQGEPRLGLTLQRGKATVVVGALADDIAGVAVNGKDASILIGTDSTGSPTLGLRDDKKTISLGVVRGNDPALTLVAGPNSLAATPAGVRVRLPDGEVVHFPTRPAGGPQGVEKPPDQSKN